MFLKSSDWRFANSFSCHASTFSASSRRRRR